MNRRQAAAAISAILESVDDKYLPKGRVETEADGTTILWFDNLSTGYHLGSAKNGWGERIPEHYHQQAVSRALVLEAVSRADRRHLEDEAARERSASDERTALAAGQS